MSVLEKDVEGAVCKYARQKGLLSLKFEPDSSRGWPDRIFLGSGGVVFFIEFKKPGEPPRPLQVHRIKILQNLGLPVFVVDSIQEGKGVIDLCTA
jgi:hypothetical protein